MKHLYLISFVVMLSYLINCADQSYVCPNCVPGSEAPPLFDDNYQGVYKGCLANINFSGHYKIVIEDVAEACTFEMVFDGYPFPFDYDKTEYLDLTTEQGYHEYIFKSYDKYGLDLAFWIDIEPDGTIYNHHSHLDLTDIAEETQYYLDALTFKETTNSHVTCYEGSLSGGITGKLVMVAIEDNIYFQYPNPDDRETAAYRFGELSDGAIANTFADNSWVKGDINDFTGSVDGDVASGNWEGTDGASGTWIAFRTL